MTSVDFKLTQQNGVTRRLTFPIRPTWSALASKIASYFGIPVENVSVAYVDADNDEVTLNSQEELDDFFRASYRPGQAIRFTVHDLFSARSERSSVAGEPKQRATSSAPIDVFDDWLLPSVPGIFVSGPNIRHAFVEEVGTEDNADSEGHNEDNHTDQIVDLSTTTQETPPTPATVTDKGKDKGRSVGLAAEDVLSTHSVLAEDSPVKLPIHVYDMSSRGKDAREPLPPNISSASLRGSPVPIIAESTPKSAIPALTPQEPATGKPASSDAKITGIESEQNVTPVASQEAPTNAPSPISLVNDVATLLRTFSTVISSHPELSEGIRNIVRNTSNGVYWHAQREAVSQMAEQVAQSTGQATTELRQRAEDEAGRRVAEALDGIIRSFSQVVGVSPHENLDSRSNNDLPVPPPPSEPPRAWGPPPPPPPPPPHNSTSFWYGFPPPNSFGFPPRPHGPPGPFPFQSWGPSRASGIASQAPPHPFMHTFAPLNAREVRPSNAQPPPAASAPQETPASHGTGPAPEEIVPTQPPHDLKAQVEAAKRYYKAEKEKYRQQREEKRRERERKAMSHVQEITRHVSELEAHETETANLRRSTSNAAAVVANAWGSHPAYELVSVNRHNTHPGHMHRREGTDQGNLFLRSFNRISKRLADMGFSEKGHPNLSSKIKAQLPPSGIVSKDGEDDIVTNLLEDLLSMPPKGPSAAGSGAKDTNIPGAWH